MSRRDRCEVISANIWGHVLCMQWKSVLQERFLTTFGFVLILVLGGGGDGGKERVLKKVVCPLKYTNKQKKSYATQKRFHYLIAEVIYVALTGHRTASSSRLSSKFHSHAFACSWNFCRQSHW